MTQHVFSILMLITIFSGNLIAQSGFDEKEMIGFACYYEGEPSTTVERMTNMLSRKKYNRIAKRLYSANNAERYMAVIILEKLVELTKYSITDNQKDRITEIKESTELVSICSGCTLFVQVELRELFRNEALIFPDYWIKRNF